MSAVSEKTMMMAECQPAVDSTDAADAPLMELHLTNAPTKSPETVGIADSQASAAQTPARKTVKDFFQKISAIDHMEQQDAMMAVDILDLRNIRPYKRDRGSKRFAIKSSQISESAIADDDDSDGNDQSTSISALTLNLPPPRWR
jgi:hypothetical protein